MWIYEYQDWPNFTWDDKSIVTKLAELRHRQGLLLGRMEGLGFEFKQESNLDTLTDDIVNSSAIEGVKLNPSEIRSSIAHQLGMDIADTIPTRRNEDGIVEIMLDATQNYSKALTKDRLFAWHSALFPNGRSGMLRIKVGEWRSGTMEIVSGSIGKEKVHFEAPSADRLEKEMQAFLAWFAKDGGIDPVLKAAIAHFWFVIIHPFEDGNGRIARAIGDMALARAESSTNRFYSLSSQIMKQRKHYYLELEKQERSTLDITDWLLWFMDCLGDAIASAEESIGRVLFKAELWNLINQRSINERQRMVISRMLKDDFTGFMKTSKYVKLAKCSNDTALRDIQDLKEKGIFIQNPEGGRSTSYRLLAQITCGEVVSLSTASHS